MSILNRIIFIISLLFVSYSLKAANEFVNVVAKNKLSVVGVGTHTPTSRPNNILRGTGFVIYPSHLKLRVSGSLSKSWSRRLFLLMVTPLKKKPTQSMTYSDFPMGLVYKRFTLRY